MILDANPLKINPTLIREEIQRNGYVIFKNYLTIDMFKLRQELLKRSNSLNDYPSKVNPENPITFFRKINLGDFGDFGEYPRFLRTTYTPYWNKECEFARELFTPIIILRNHISNLPLELGLYPDYTAGLWSGCRFQQYFCGGGFFSEHKDVIVEKISNDLSMPTIQLVALITSKGIDFNEGGATIRSSNNMLINLEDYASSGDVIAYDASSVHGVLPIDQHKELDLSLNTGRLVALASLYKIIK